MQPNSRCLHFETSLVHVLLSLAMISNEPLNLRSQHRCNAPVLFIVFFSSPFRFTITLLLFSKFPRCDHVYWPVRWDSGFLFSHFLFSTARTGEKQNRNQFTRLDKCLLSDEATSLRILAGCFEFHEVRRSQGEHRFDK
ncbi:hypothetical protein BDW68DRAFT_15505 [Aspergillus falconensis]